MQKLAQLFKALSDETRLRIVNLIIETGEICACDIQRVLGFTQTKVSRHLAYLKHSGILQDRRSGGWMLYSLVDADDPAKKILFKELGGLFQNEPTLQKDLDKLCESINAGRCVSACELPNKFNIEAKNSINARAGQVVEVDYTTASITRNAFYVYLLPLVTMFVGFIVAYCGTCHQLGNYSGLEKIIRYQNLARIFSKHRYLSYIFRLLLFNNIGGDTNG